MQSSYTIHITKENVRKPLICDKDRNRKTINNQSKQKNKVKLSRLID